MEPPEQTLERPAAQHSYFQELRTKEVSMESQETSTPIATSVVILRISSPVEEHQPSASFSAKLAQRPLRLPARSLLKRFPLPMGKPLLKLLLRLSLKPPPWLLLRQSPPPMAKLLLRSLLKPLLRPSLKPLPKLLLRLLLRLLLKPFPPPTVKLLPRSMANPKSVNLSKAVLLSFKLEPALSARSMAKHSKL